MSFNEIITLYPGNTTFEYRVLIMADILDEFDEMFQAIITLESGGGVIINDQADTANITIQDLNRKFCVCIYLCDYMYLILKPCMYKMINNSFIMIVLGR